MALPPNTDVSNGSEPARWPTGERAAEVATCPCGSAWFELHAEETEHGTALGAVSLNGDGGVIAYSGVPRCLECGRAWSPSGAYLQIVK